MRLLTLLLCVLAMLPAPARAADFYVALNGNDTWSGTLPAPNRAGNDGPFATLPRAQQAVRSLRGRQPDRRAPVVVQVRQGTHFLPEPLLFTPEDSGTAAAPVLYEAYQREAAQISGGVRLTGWRRAGGNRWTLSLPAVQRGEWAFAQLFVNGQRRYRPRLPREGYYTIQGEVPPSARAGQGSDRFRFRAGDVRAGWYRPGDIEALCFHIWSMSRLPLGAVDEASRVVTLGGSTLSTVWWANLPSGGRYLLENVREALGRPGEWYLDRGTGILTYLALPGEDPNRDEVVAPRLPVLVRLRGEAALGLCVEHMTFRGLTFAHTNWTLPPAGYSCGQAEVVLGGAITAQGARSCALERCTVAHVGGYAVEFGAGCRDNRVEACVLTDLGAGGVKLGTQGWEPDAVVAGRQVVRDCRIAHGGRMHPAAVGVWIGHAPYNVVERNEITDFYYTGVSVGWSWGYGPSQAHHNTIADNHIHGIGQGVLSDLGGIYTLGVSPGTVLRHNRIHDVESFGYGGWGIYLDEGTTAMLIEDNLCYRTKSPGFRQHYGKENVARNNILAWAREGQVGRGRDEEHLSYTVEGNVITSPDGAPMVTENMKGSNYRFDRNLYWSGKQPASFAGQTCAPWRATGQDRNSLVADPLFVAPEKGDFRLRPGSPAGKIGFRPFPLDGFGPRPGTVRAAGRGAVPRAFPPLPPPQPPMPIVEDFEGVPVGEKTPGTSTYEENDRATARVTEETAASGKRCLKVVDLSGQKAEYNPHLFFSPGFREGVMAGRFDLRVEAGTYLYHEWRDYALAPFRVGPALWFAEDGTLTANGRKLLQIPHGRWVRYEIRCALGAKSTATYDLTVGLPDAAPRVYRGLPCDPQFRKLDWYGFTANANHAGTFYVDNIHLAPEGKAAAK